MQTEQIISILYKKLVGGGISADEQAALDAWIAENPEQRQRMIDGLSDSSHLTEGFRIRSMIDPTRPLEDMQRRLAICADTASDSHPRHSTRRWHLPLAAAACAAVIIGVFMLFNRLSVAPLPYRDATASTAKATPLIIENLGPGSSRAVVTTPKGDTIMIDGQHPASALARNSVKGPMQIDVPRGGEFVVTLEDSTRVWLNSESRLIYPSHFAADCRKVELEGEAFFEVTENKSVPFIVESSGQLVKVYGTEFNIRAYPEEDKIYTSLSSGKISLTPMSGGGELFLSPGKQAMFDKETSKAVIRNIDLDRVTGWRHGRFVFEEQSLRQIMQDLSRWYDFSYEFSDDDAAETIFMGSIPRYSNFKTAIAILEKSGGLSFQIKEDKILISSKH